MHCRYAALAGLNLVWDSIPRAVPWAEELPRLQRSARCPRLSEYSISGGEGELEAVFAVRCRGSNGCASCFVLVSVVLSGQALTPMGVRGETRA